MSQKASIMSPRVTKRNRLSLSWKAGYRRNSARNIVEQCTSNDCSDSCDELEDVRDLPAA